MKPEYRDRNGWTHGDIVLGMSARTADWPKIPRTTKDRDGLQSDFHREFAGKPCWYCQSRVGSELHHLAAGSRGRSHERCLFAWACSECHRNNVGKDDLPVWLYGKWKFDPMYFDWLVLTIRFSEFLPEIGRS